MSSTPQPEAELITTDPRCSAITSTLLHLPIELSYMIFDALLADREVHLGKEENEEGTFNLARTCTTLHKEIESWKRGKAHLPQAVCCGIFDPETTVFYIDLGFLAQHAYLTSFVLGGAFSIHNCTDPTWLRIERAWSDEQLLENIQHLQIDVGNLSNSLHSRVRNPSNLLFSLFWNHFARPQKLQHLDIKLDVSQSPYKLDWQSTILADIWVWLGLCEWHVLHMCMCYPPEEYLTIRYQDTSSKQTPNTWLPLTLEGSQAMTTFIVKCPQRQRQRDRNLSLGAMIRANQTLDTNHEEWRRDSLY